MASSLVRLRNVCAIAFSAIAIRISAIRGIPKRFNGKGRVLNQLDTVTPKEEREEIQDVIQRK